MLPVPTRTHRSRPIAVSLFAALAVALLAGGARADSVCALWPDGTFCRPLNTCLDSGTCQGGDCVSNTPMPSGTVCRVSADPCQEDSTCDGAGACVTGALRPVGTVCQDSSNPCGGNKVCNAMGQCLAGTTLPAGTICRISLNPCMADNICDAMGQCVPGTPKAAGTVCLDASPCRSAGTCNGSGVCNAGMATNEGRACIGGNFCEDTVCQAGVCSSRGTRDCSAGDPCRKKDACMPNVGCLVVNICDMAVPPDLTGLDLMSVDLTPPPDLAVPDLSVPIPDMRSVRDAAMPRDSGSNSDGAQPPHLTTYLTGGACACRVGGAEAPPPLALLLGLGAVLRLRRRRR